MKIFAAHRDDSQQGWVWLKKPNMLPRAIVKITDSETRRVVYCEALQIDNNFLTEYNHPPRLSITTPDDALVISGWYRAKLGGIKTKSDRLVSIEICNGFWGRIRACLDHPQTVVRVATWLGIISVVLGCIGVTLGVISLLPCKT